MVSSAAFDSSAERKQSDADIKVEPNIEGKKASDATTTLQSKAIPAITLTKSRSSKVKG